MKLQKYEEINLKIREAFEKAKSEHPEKFERRIDVSYCCQTFGWEPIPKSIERLAKYGYKYIELPGQYGGPEIGPHTQLPAILEAMEKYDVKCSGVCVLVQEGFALNDKNYYNRQRAVDFLRNVAKFAKACGGQYVLFTPAAVQSRPQDGGDWIRAVSTLHDCGHIFTDEGVKGAVEPCQPGGAFLVTNFTEAKRFIREVDNPGVQHIYGDLDHIIHTEEHLAQAILDCGDQLLNIHLRDINGLPLGHGMIDVDTVIRALYLLGFNTPGHFATAEPATRGKMFEELPEELKIMRCRDTIECFREREEAVLSA